MNDKDYLLAQIKYLEDITNDIKYQLKNARTCHDKGYIKEEQALLLNSMIYEFFSEGKITIRKICKMYDKKWLENLEGKKSQ